MSWRRILLYSLVLVIALGGVTWSVLHRSDAASGIVQRQLDALLLAPVTLGGTELDLGAGRIIVRELHIADPNRPGQPLLRAAQVDLDASFDIGQIVALRRVGVSGLEVDIGENPPALAQLLRTTAPDENRAASALPALAITDGRVRIGCTPGREPIQLTALNATATPRLGDEQTFVVTGSARVEGLGATVEIAGHVDSESGATEFTARVTNWPLETACLQWLEGRLGIAFSDPIDLAGTLRQLELTFRTAPDESGAMTTRVEARGQLQQARLAAASLPRHLQSATIDFVGSSRNGGELRAQIQQPLADGSIDITVDVTGMTLGADELSYTVRATGKNLQVDDDTLDALRLFDLGAEIVDALAPRAGRADMEFFLRDPQRATGKVEFDMQVREGELAYRGFETRGHRIGFALPLEGAQGTVRLREGIVELIDMSARIKESAGGGDVTLTGRINTVVEPLESTTLDIRAENVRFTSALRTALADLLTDDGALYDSLRPRGNADVDVAVRPESQLDGLFAVTITPRDAAVLWQEFPYELAAIRGSIVVHYSKAEFDLVGRHGDGSVTLHGRLPIEYENDGTGSNNSEGTEREGVQVAVELEGLAIDEDLRVAVRKLAPDIDKPWGAVAPSGRCSGFVRAWQPASAAAGSSIAPDLDGFHYDLRLDVEDVELRLAVDPWFARDLNGRILITGSGEAMRIDFDALRGRLDHGAATSAQLAMLGRVEYSQKDREPGASRAADATATTDQTDSDLSLVVRGLELDDALGNALATLGALEQETWDFLQPSGAVDLVCRHRVTPANDADLDIVVHLLDVGTDAAILPRPARKMTGEVHVANGRIGFEEVRAELGGKLVQLLDGTISEAPEPDGRTLVAFTVKATDFPVDEHLARLFAGPLRQSIAGRRLSGRAGIERLKLAFAVPPAGSSMPFETTLSGELRLQDVGLTLGEGRDGLRVRRLYGDVKLDESRVGDGGGGLAGRLTNASLQLVDQPFEGLSGRFQADSQRLVLDGLDARLHGGTFRQRNPATPAFVYTLPAPATPDGRLQVDVDFKGVDVNSFLRKTGWESPPYRGDARGALRIDRLDGQAIVDAVGNGTLVIERGDLGAVPLFTAIYAQMPAPERPRFTDLEATWSLGEQRLAFERLLVKSNLLSAEGDGTLGLDGYVDIQLKLANLLGNSADPLVTPFVEFFAGNFVSFHLYGHLRNLVAEQRIFGQGAPDRSRVPPLPPIMPRTETPDY